MSEPISKFSGDGYCSGFYNCDCGEYYFQEYCGVPTDISFCANCYKKRWKRSKINNKRRR